LEAGGLVAIPSENPMCVTILGLTVFFQIAPTGKLNTFASTMRSHLNMLWGIQRFTKVLEVFDLQSLKIVPHSAAAWLSVVR